MNIPEVGTLVKHVPSSTTFTLKRRTKHKETGAIELWLDDLTRYPVDECEPYSPPDWVETALCMVEAILAGQEPIDALSALEGHRFELWQHLSQEQKDGLKRLKDASRNIQPEGSFSPRKTPPAVNPSSPSNSPTTRQGRQATKESPKPVPDITHVRKPGWRGVIYDRPWGLPTMLDIQWTEAPEDIEVPRFPSRYPIADLRQNDKEIAS